MNDLDVVDLIMSSRRAAAQLANLAFLDYVDEASPFASDAHVFEMAAAVAADATRTLLADRGLDLRVDVIDRINSEALQAFRERWQDLRRRAARGGSA